VKIYKEKEAEDFLSRKGFPIIKADIFSNDKEAHAYAQKIGFPLVLKIVGKLHKSDHNGVRVKVTEDDFYDEFYDLKKITRKVMVQKYMHGKQVIVGLKKDPTFGHTLLFGLGGIFVEALKDISFRVCPVTNNDIDEMIREIKGYSILSGLRGEKPVNILKIKKIMIKLCKLSSKYPNIEELDINPLIVNHKDAKIVDARIIFS